MPQKFINVNDGTGFFGEQGKALRYLPTDPRGIAYEKINENFSEIYAALLGAGGTVGFWGQIGGILSAQTDLAAALAGKETAGAVAAHEALGDPHAQYLTTSEGNALFDASGAASSSLAAHLLAADPHPGYLTPAEGASLYAPIAAPTAAVAAHEALADPHPQYLVVAEGDARYQGIDATLGALAALNATAGILEQTGPDAFTKRALGVGSAGSIPTRADADARYDAAGAAAAAQAASQEASARLTAIAAMSTVGYLYFNGTTIVPAAGGGGGGNSWYPSGW